MAGFLDRNTRIIDMVLTGHGKSLLSQGQLRFCYWTPFDDEVDYQPPIVQSASMSPEQLSASIYRSIEDTPIREATTGYRTLNSSGSDFTNVHRPIFTMAQGQVVLPRTVFPHEENRNIHTTQRKVQRIYQDRDRRGRYANSLEARDIGTERFDASTFSLEFSYTKDSFPSDFQPEGFHVRVYRSGSNGWAEVVPRRDMSNDISYNNDVRVFTGQTEN